MKRLAKAGGFFVRLIFWLSLSYIFADDTGEDKFLELIPLWLIDLFLVWLIIQCIYDGNFFIAIVVGLLHLVVGGLAYLFGQKVLGQDLLRKREIS